MKDDDDKLTNKPCKHDWLYELELFMHRGTRYYCCLCDLKVEHFEGRDAQIEARIEQARRDRNT